MAGVEKITGKIIADSDVKAKEIHSTANHQVEEILKRAEREQAIKIEELKKQLEIEIAQRTRIYESRRDLESRNALLSTKQNLMETVFQKAIDQVGQLDTTAYQAIIKKMLLEAVELGTEEVLISSKDQVRITGAFMEDVNQSLKQLGKIGNLKLSESFVSIAGGFVLKNADVNINYSFESLLRSKRDALEPELAEILF